MERFTAPCITTLYERWKGYPFFATINGLCSLISERRLSEFCDNDTACSLEAIHSLFCLPTPQIAVGTALARLT